MALRWDYFQWTRFFLVPLSPPPLPFPSLALNLRVVLACLVNWFITQFTIALYQIYILRNANFQWDNVSVISVVDVAFTTYLGHN